jgi:WD40 repeat protein
MAFLLLITLVAVAEQGEEAWSIERLTPITDETAAEVRQLTVFDVNEALYASAFSPDGRTIAYGGAERLFLRDIETEDGLWQTDAQDVSKITFSSDGSTMAVRYDGRLFVWDQVDFSLNLLSQPLQVAEVVGSLTDFRFTSGNQQLVGVVARSGRIYRWNTQSGNLIFGHDLNKPEESFANYSLLNPNGSRNYLVLIPGTVEVRDTVDGDLIAQSQIRDMLDWPEIPATLLISPLAVSDEDPTLLLRVDNPSTPGQSGFVGLSADGVLYLMQDNPYNHVFPGALSPDNRILALGKGEEGDEIYLWDITQGEELVVLASGHTERLTSLSFNADGTLLMSTSIDGTLRLWGIPAGE